MDEMNNLSNFDFSNKKMYETKLYLFKLDVRKVFSKKLKFKSRINNFYNSKLLKITKPSKESKNSQTNIKKYNYDLNNIFKSNNLTESINFMSSIKSNFPSEILPYKIPELKESNKSKNFGFRRSVSLKPKNLSNSLYNSLDIKERKTFYKKIKIKKKKKTMSKNTSENSFKTRKNLENIGADFFNNSCINKLNKLKITNSINNSNINSSDNYKNKKIKYKIINSNNKYPVSQNNINNVNINIIKKKNLPKKISNTYAKIAIQNILNKKHTYNDIYFRNNINFRNKAIFSNELGKTANWKNNILNDLIININKENKENQKNFSKYLDFIDDNFHSSQKIKISTLINLNNKSSNRNYKYIL